MGSFPKDRIRLDPTPPHFMMSFSSIFRGRTKLPIQPYKTDVRYCAQCDGPMVKRHWEWPKKFRTRLYCSPKCYWDAVTPSLESRFWNSVDRRGDDECWPWRGYGRDDGRGALADKGRLVFATHVSLEIHGRPRPGNLWALHSCDNPPCVNPKHLRWGTPKENTMDAVDRGQLFHSFGEKHGFAKLTDELVIAIRRRDRTLADWSRELGITQTALCSARKGKTWRHIREGLQ